MLKALDISTSAMVAQRVRINAIAGNIANVSTTHNERGLPGAYRPRHVIFEVDESIGTPGQSTGVKVASVETLTEEQHQPIYKRQPNHPDAIKSGPRKGYVAYPNINLVNEFVDAMEATRAYEANIGMIEVTKDMSRQSLRIIA